MPSSALDAGEVNEAGRLLSQSLGKTDVEELGKHSRPQGGGIEGGAGWSCRRGRKTVPTDQQYQGSGGLFRVVNGGSWGGVVGEEMRR